MSAARALRSAGTAVAHDATDLSASARAGEGYKLGANGARPVLGVS
jgi:hypothetical protein